MSSLFYRDITNLKGVGAKRSQLFYRLGIKSIGALLRFYPRDYRDFSKITKIGDIQENIVYCIKASLKGEIKSFTTKNNLQVYKLRLYDESGEIDAIVFNNRYIYNIVKPNKEYLFLGKVTIRGNIAEMSSLIISQVGKETIEPIYGQTEGLSTNIIKRCVKNALDLLPNNMPDTLPEKIREKYKLCSLNFAIKNIHFPKSKEDLKKAQLRLSLERLLTFYLAMTYTKSELREKNNGVISYSFKSEFLELLPFNLTSSQDKALTECLKEMKDGEYTMRRMLQGDVGCGKTVVAGGLIFCAIKNNGQAVVMAPTEILAQQHYKYFNNLFEKSNIKTEILTSSTPTAKKREILQKVVSGEIDLLIGTHALLSDNLQFNNLILVVTDEQHRFGVQQRYKLSCKGKNPHILLMSATPIPRSLALILFGELDISTIEEMPKNRVKVKTFLITSNERTRAFNFIKKQIEDGGQAYIVCPAIEKSDKPNTKSLEEYEEIIAKSCLHKCKYRFLHGKMSDREKQIVMADFSEQRIDLIISTTVIEVGIDVPNAGIILIESADCFGFSQLHQLRGRVGRGQRQSYCILLSDNENEESLQRLRTMCRVNDGFKISAEDLKLRGAGDFFGERQHGEMNRELLKGLSDVNILSKITDMTEDILKDDIYSEKYKYLRGQIRMELKNKKLV